MERAFSSSVPKNKVIQLFAVAPETLSKTLSLLRTYSADRGDWQTKMTEMARVQGVFTQLSKHLDQATRVAWRIDWFSSLAFPDAPFEAAFSAITNLTKGRYRVRTPSCH